MTCVKTAGFITWQIPAVLKFVCQRIFDSCLHFSDTHKEVAATGQRIWKIYRKTGNNFDINTINKIIVLIVNALTVIYISFQAKITNDGF